MERQWRAEEKARLSVIVPYLADRGWYFYWWVPADESEKVGRLLDEGAHEKIEQHMISLAKEHTPYVREGVQQDWPRRALILDDAFDAHEKGQFTLSIPVMLTQADGISKEIGQGLHFTKKGRKQIRDEITDLLEYGSATDVLVELLFRETALNEKTDVRDAKRKKDPQHGPLNRHGVLHGTDLDYPTLANSLRVIVLLGYLQEMQMFVLAKKRGKRKSGGI